MSVPECQNCGAHVTARYVRVRAIDEEEGVHVCPQCPDKIRGNGGRPREARSTRRNHEDGAVNHERTEATADTTPTLK